MKKILIVVVLLIAVGLCCKEMGRYDLSKEADETDTEWNTMAEMPHGEDYFAPMHVHPDDIINLNEYFLKELLSLYEEYEQECYADSSWFSDIIWLDDCACIMPHWTHQQSTFKGFIKFIRNKIKE